MKVHLGCWHRHIPGFVHVDLCDFPHIDYRSGIDALPFFADDSADLIYCSHALEYFDRDQAVAVLTEWRRVLKPGGILRLAVPDFPVLVRVYQETGDLGKILGPLYGKMKIASGDQQMLTLYHRTVYDETELTALLVKVGFGETARWDWRTTEHAHVDDHSQAYFPHMQKDTGILVSLNIQARKITSSEG